MAVPHACRVTVDVAEEGLVAGVDHLHRPAGPHGEHAELHLHAEVLPGAEGPADAGEVDAHLVDRERQAGGDLDLVDMDPLGGDVEVDAAIGRRDGEPGLGAHEGLVLHPRLVGALDHDGAARLRVTPEDALGEEPVAERMDRVGLKRRLRVNERLADFVGDDDGLRCPARRLGMVGGNSGDRLAVVADDVGGEDRLVGLVEPVGLAARHVLVGDDGPDAAHLQGGRHVHRR